MKKLWETGIMLFAVAGFWGMIYPDLCFVPDVCQAGTECGKEAACEEAEWDGAWEPDIYTRICMAQPGQVRGKSRLLELLQTRRKEPEKAEN